MKNFKFIIAAALTVMTVACEMDDLKFGRPRSRTGTEVERHKKDSTGGVEVPDTAVWVTAVSYPEDYYWRYDSLEDSNGAVLELYCNSVKKLSIPTGFKYRISSYGDKNHFLDGAVYSDWFDGQNTYLSRNGVLIASWEGRYMVKGLMKDGDTLWTLASSRTGKGLLLLKNGVEAFRADNGCVFGSVYDSACPTGGFYETGGRKCFCYYEEDAAGGFKKNNYYTWVDGKLEKHDSQVENVDDMRVCSAHVFFVGRNKSDKDVVRVVMDGTQTLLSGTRGLSIRSCKLMEIGSSVYISGIEYKDKNSRNTVLWNSRGLVKRFYDRDCYFYRNGDNVGVIDTNLMGHDTSIDYLNRREDTHYSRFVNPRNAVFFDGKPYIAFDWGDDGFVTWHNGDTSYVKINGYAVCINVTVKKK